MFWNQKKNGRLASPKFWRRGVVGVFLNVILATEAKAPSEESAWIQKIETYLSQIKTLTADFTQLDPNGGLSKGKFYLSRPGRFCFEYTHPFGQRIITDGIQIYMDDSNHEETTVVPLESSPARFLLEADFKLGNTSDNQVTSVEESATRIQLTLIRRQDPEAGSVTLTFRKFPLQLAQWIVKDAQHLETLVNLSHLQEGGPIPPEKFHFLPTP